MDTNADMDRPAGATIATKDDVRQSLDEARHVGVIEILRPPHNHLDGDVLAEVVQGADRLASLGARALVLCSEGKNFCAGANFGGSGSVAGSGRNDVYELGIELLEQPLPIVAAVQGAAVGGGVGLALVADLRVATPRSTFWLNFSRLGMHHGFGMSVTLPLVVGHQRAMELLYTSRRIDGETALRMGLCDHIAPPEQLRRHAFELAGEIAANAPLATRAIRRTLRGPLVEDVKAAMKAERALQNEIIRTDDFREGTAAVRERRAPAFQGR